MYLGTRCNILLNIYTILKKDQICGNVDGSPVTDGSYVVIFMIYIQYTLPKSRGPVHAAKSIAYRIGYRISYSTLESLNFFVLLCTGLPWFVNNQMIKSFLLHSSRKCMQYKVKKVSYRQCISNNAFPIQIHCSQIQWKDTKNVSRYVSGRCSIRYSHTLIWRLSQVERFQRWVMRLKWRHVWTNCFNSWNLIQELDTLLSWNIREMNKKTRNLMPTE